MYLLVIFTLPLWLPITAAVALIALFAGGRPVFFTQLRAGKDGKPFRLLKFRTMREGAGTDAERLTKFGAFLRRTSLDELPELFNILKGDMALVGPRPLPVRYLERYTPQQNRRHEVKPGLTGWAQVHGRNALDWETKFRYDVDYVDSRSFWLDVKILLLTVRTVLAGDGVAHAGETTMSEFTGSKQYGERAVTMSEFTGSKQYGERAVMMREFTGGKE